MTIDYTARTTAIGVFLDREKADEAVGDLKTGGFDVEHIKVDVQPTPLTDLLSMAVRTDSNVEESASAGVLTGGGLGLMAGVAVAAGVLTPVGPAVAGGAIGGLLASTAFGAATGGCLGGLIGMGFSEEEAAFYESEYKAGRTIVTVKTCDSYSLAAQILERHGAYDITRIPVKMKNEQNKMVEQAALEAQSQAHRTFPS